MSKENVEIVRRAWSAFRERGIDGAADYVADNAVTEDFPELPDRAAYPGKEGFRRRYWHLRRELG